VCIAWLCAWHGCAHCMHLWTRQLVDLLGVWPCTTHGACVLVRACITRTGINSFVCNFDAVPSITGGRSADVAHAEHTGRRFHSFFSLRHGPISDLSRVCTKLAMLVPWRTMAYCGVPWDTVGYRGVPWCRYPSDTVNVPRLFEIRQVTYCHGTVGPQWCGCTILGVPHHRLAVL
jgi:hypothetical protein